MTPLCDRVRAVLTENVEAENDRDVCRIAQETTYCDTLTVMTQLGLAVAG